MFGIKTKFSPVNNLVYTPKPLGGFKKNPRFWLLFLNSVLAKYRVRLLISIILLATVIITSKILVDQFHVFRSNLVIGVVGNYTVENLPQPLSRLYSAGLTKFDSSGQVLPDLAKSWQTENGKKFTFTLKENILWQDGKKLTANDIDFFLPNTQVKVLDQGTLEFSLTDTFVPFPAVLTKPVFYKDTSIGTGPFKLANVTNDGESLKEIMLEPTQDELPFIKIMFFGNSQTATTAFKTGQVDLLFNLSSLNGLKDWKGSEITGTLDPTRLIGIFYNTKDDLLKSNNLRKALDLSINRSGFNHLATGPYPTTSWVYNNTQPVFDLGKAAQLLEDEPLENTELTILTPATFQNLAQEIKTNWESLGIKTKIENIESIPVTFQVAIFGLEIPQDPDQYAFWHSTQSSTLTRIEDPKLDKLLEDGRKLVDKEERKEVYLEFQKELRNIVPASFLFFQDRFIVVNNNSQDELNQIKKRFPEFPIN